MWTRSRLQVMFISPETDGNKQNKYGALGLFAVRLRSEWPLLALSAPPMMLISSLDCSWVFSFLFLTSPSSF